MQYRDNPKNGQRLSALGFGCMRFPSSSLGSIDIDAAERLVTSAVDAGINYFDTAFLYRNNEAALGEIFKRNPGLREKINIATKLPQPLCKKESDFDSYFTRELESLGVEAVDYYLIHNMGSLADWTRLVDLGITSWIDDRKRDGSIVNIGFSFHGPEGEFIRLVDAYDWDFVQIQYNYLDEHNQAGKSGLEYAASAGLPVIIMEPLLGGVLADKLPAAVGDLFAEKPCSATRTIETPVAWALRWVWNHPEVTVVLSGMNEPSQLSENVAIVETALPNALDADDRAVIERARDTFRESYKVPCTGCNYCMPCPQKVTIPGTFAAYNASYALGWYQGEKTYVMNINPYGDQVKWAGNCTACGACVKKCPQHIDIPTELQRARKRIEPFYIRWGVNIMRKFTR